MAKQISFEFEKKKYTLEYTLRTAGQCEQDGFVMEQLGDRPATMIPLLFHWAFVRHHRGIAKQLTSKIYENMNHKNELVSTLAEMYADAVNALVDTDEETEGNANWTLT